MYSRGHKCPPYLWMVCKRLHCGLVDDVMAWSAGKPAQIVGRALVARVRCRYARVGVDTPGSGLSRFVGLR